MVYGMDFRVGQEFDKFKFKGMVDLYLGFQIGNSVGMLAEKDFVLFQISFYIFFIKESVWLFFLKEREFRILLYYEINYIMCIIYIF